MAYPGFKQLFMLHLHASQDGLGGILYQTKEDGKTAVIGYGSRTLSRAEQNYHLHSEKLEFLALSGLLHTGLGTTFIMPLHFK